MKGVKIGTHVPGPHAHAPTVFEGKDPPDKDLLIIIGVQEFLHNEYVKQFQFLTYS